MSNDKNIPGSDGNLIEPTCVFNCSKLVSKWSHFLISMTDLVGCTATCLYPLKHNRIKWLCKLDFLLFSGKLLTYHKSRRNWSGALSLWHHTGVSVFATLPHFQELGPLQFFVGLVGPLKIIIFFAIFFTCGFMRRYYQSSICVFLRSK